MLTWTLQIVAPMVAGAACLTWCCLVVLLRLNFIPQTLTVLGLQMSILASVTNVPKLKERLAQIEPSQAEAIDKKAIVEQLEKKIFGQNHAIKEVIENIYGQKLRDKRDGPLAVYMIAGPPGTGKSQFGIALGKALFGAHGTYVIDLATANSAANANAVFGVPAGYVGGDQPSPAMAHLMQHPKTVLVIDEFEKTTDEVRNRFLSAWQDGWITNVSSGRKISVRDVVFIITTNARQEEIAQLASDPSLSPKELSDRAKRVLALEFNTAILSRIDMVFAFKPLEGFPMAELIGSKIMEFVDSYSMELVNIDLEILVKYVQRFKSSEIDGRSLAFIVRDEYRERLIELKKKGVKRVTISDKKNNLTIEAA